MIKKLVSALMALTLLAGVTISSTAPAEAGRGGRVAAGIAAGIIGLGVLGAYAQARDRGDYRYSYRHRARDCYRGAEECGWVDRHCFRNRWGERVCRGGRWTCWRDEVCD